MCKTEKDYYSKSFLCAAQPRILARKSVIRITYRYKDVRERLEKERATTPAKLEWSSPPQTGAGNILLVAAQTKGNTASNRSSVQSSGLPSPANPGSALSL